MSQWLTFGEGETISVGEDIGSTLEAGEVLRLHGAMGSGKTVFVRGIARGLGIDPTEIRSPTFTLVHEHRGGLHALLHLDLYRLEEEDFDRLGFGELMEGSSIKVIEWAEHLPSGYRSGRSFSFAREERGRHRILEGPDRRPDIRRDKRR